MAKMAIVTEIMRIMVICRVVSTWMSRVKTSWEHTYPNVSEMDFVRSGTVCPNCERDNSRDPEDYADWKPLQNHEGKLLIPNQASAALAVAFLIDQLQLLEEAVSIILIWRHVRRHKEEERCHWKRLCKI